MSKPYHHVGIIGFGSIAQKHLTEVLDCNPNAKILIKTRQNIAEFDPPENVSFTASIEDFFGQEFDVIMVATPASEHSDHIQKLYECSKELVIEKPIAANSIDAKQIAQTAHGRPIHVAYNLRYLEGLLVLKELLSTKTLGVVQDFSMTVGQDLAEWRPGRDYKTSVSAQASKGGGVLRELSHELDLACHLFGNPKENSLVRAKTKYKALDVEDTAVIKATFSDGQINGSIALDFTRKQPERRITIAGNKASLEWDLINGEIYLDNGQINECIFTKLDDIKTTYGRMWEDLLGGKKSRLPNATDGLELIKWIEAMEKNSPMITGA